MENPTSEKRIGEEERHGRLVDCDERRHGSVTDREVSKRRVSSLAVEGSGGGAGMNDAGRCDQAGGGGVVAKSPAKQEGRTLPPPHAWLAIEDVTKNRSVVGGSDDPDEQWLHLLRGGGGGGVASGTGGRHANQQQQRRSSFSVVRRERAAREAWLDRAWEMKRSWHARNGGAPDADRPVVVVVGKGHGAAEGSSSPPSSDHHHHAGAVGSCSGVAMDVDEVRACRDLGLELPSDCTVEIQCYGLSGDTSPTHHTGDTSGADDSLCAGISSPGADPTDVKARLKVWAQAVALTSTTQLGS